MAGIDDDVVDEVAVRVVATATGLVKDVRQKVAAQQKLKGQPTYKVKVVANGAGLKASVAKVVKEQMALTKQPVYKVKVVADSKGIKVAVAEVGKVTKDAAKDAALEADKVTTKVAQKTTKALVKIHAAGVRERRRAEKAEANAGLNSEKFLVGLKVKSIKAELKQIRNASEVLEREQKEAEKNRLDDLAKGLHYRLALAREGEKATQKRLDAAKAEEDAADRRFEDAGKKRRAKEKVAAAEKLRIENARLAAEKAAAAEKLRENIARQRSDEAYVNFIRQNNEELGKNDRGRAEDEIKIHHETQREIERIERDGQRARITLLAAEERIEKENLRRREAAEKDSQARRNSAKKFFSGGPQLIDLGGEGIRPMNLLYGVVTAMTPALFAMSASAVQASTSIAALGSAGIGAALGLGGVFTAFQGIGEALNLRQTVLGEDATKAANLGQKAARSADEIAQKQRSLADAQRGEVEAARDLHNARQEAVRDLEDLRQAVVDLDNQYKGDKVSVAEAKQNEAATNRNFFATALDRVRAHQDTLDAQTQLKDTALERRQKKVDLARSLKGGIEGSDRVRDARERVRDARDRTLDAKAALRDRGSSTAGGIDKVSSAAAKLKKKLAELGPEATKVFDFFVANEEQFKRLRREISQATLPGFNTFLSAITSVPKGGKSTLQLAAQYAGELGGIIGKYAGEFAEWMKLPLFRDSMARMQETNAAAFDKLGQALLVLADPITRILDKAAPGFEDLADVVLRLSKAFAGWIEKLDENGGLTQWFKDSRAEAKKWFDIVGNILTIIKNVFMGALPAGGTLVDRFEEWTASLAELSGKPENLKRIADFFKFFADLPYAKIIDFIKNATALFLAFQGLKYAYAHPVVAALTAFAAANPKAAADAMGVIAKAISTIVEQLAAHPDAALGIIGILAAAKAGKAIGFSIKIPAVNALKNALTSKFKVLDKFLGGGASTATMTVNAGVVNVYGKAVNGGLIPDIGPDGKPGKPGKPSRILNGVEAVGVSSVVTAAVLFGATAGWEEFQRGLGKDKRPFVSWTDIFKDDFSFDTIWKAGIDNSAINLFTVLGAKWAPEIGHFFSMTLPNLLSGKTNGWAGVGTYLLEQLSMYGGDGILGGIIDGLTGNAYTEFKEKISGWVDGVIDWFKSCFGIASPSTKTIPIGADLVNGVWSGFTTQWETLRDTVTTWIDEHFTTPLTSIFTTAGGTIAAGFARGFATITKKLAAPAEAVLKWIDMNFINKINALLTSLGATSIPTLTGTSAKDAGKGVGNIIGNVGKKLNKGKEGPRHADGGIITGSSPHPRADNIPAMLTANEYVQPVAAVKHYGTDFMEAVRTRKLPKYAKGGLVGALTGQFGNNLLTKIAGAAITKAGGTVAAAAARISSGFGTGTGTGGGGISGISGISGLIGAGGASGKALIEFGHYLQGLGYSVTEHPAFGGVHGGHATHSWHYRGGAIDVNRGSGTSKREQRYLAAIIPEAHRRGLRSIFMSPKYGHYDHAHFDIGKADGGLVRKYDTGGVLPPGYSTVYNGTGRNETVRTQQQEQRLGDGRMRLDPRDINLLAGAVTRTTTPPMTMDGRRVAEVTNRYNYLPAGV